MKFYFEPGTSIQPALIHAGDKARGLYISVADAGAQQLVGWLNTVVGVERDMLAETLIATLDTQEAEVKLLLATQKYVLELEAQRDALVEALIAAADDLDIIMDQKGHTSNTRTVLARIRAALALVRGEEDK